jgi:hypothetical protein
VVAVASVAVTVAGGGGCEWRRIGRVIARGTSKAEGGKEVCLVPAARLFLISIKYTLHCTRTLFYWQKGFFFFFFKWRSARL